MVSKIFKEATILSAKTVNGLRVYVIEDPARAKPIQAVEEIVLPHPACLGKHDIGAAHYRGNKKEVGYCCRSNQPDRKGK